MLQGGPGQQATLSNNSPGGLALVCPLWISELNSGPAQLSCKVRQTGLLCFTPRTTGRGTEAQRPSGVM